MNRGFRSFGYSCEQSGCFNQKHRMKFGIFYDALPGKISCTDVDATVEVNGSFLFLESKSGEPRPLPTGQRLYFERLTALSQRITAVILCGDCENMEFHALLVVHNGRIGDWQPTTTEILQQRIRRWALRAQGVAVLRRSAA